MSEKPLPWGSGPGAARRVPRSERCQNCRITNNGVHAGNMSVKMSVVGSARAAAVHRALLWEDGLAP